MTPDIEPGYMPTITKGKRGYMAHGIGWAVGPCSTQDEALVVYRKRQDAYREIDERWQRRQEESNSGL